MIDYDPRAGQIVEMNTFADTERDSAHHARLERELDLHRKGINREVVLLQAADEKAIRRTHRRYFETLEQLSHPPKASNS
ncbi:MAG TPA: hypothetical protein VHS31_08760 [Tepidisphaeraceae bacterium]|nr:hypothetical protein [Tepidisphaeraceae bacterium]